MNPWNAHRFFSLFCEILAKSTQKIEEELFFEEKVAVAGFKNKILAVFLYFLEKKTALPLFLRENCIDSQGNIAFSDWQQVYF